MAHEKQLEILRYLNGVEQATKVEIYNNVPFGYYRNWGKHFGILLNRMIKNHSIKRVEHGVYAINRNASHIDRNVENIKDDKSQIKLF